MRSLNLIDLRLCFHRSISIWIFNPCMQMIVNGFVYNWNKFLKRKKTLFWNTVSIISNIVIIISFSTQRKFRNSQRKYKFESVEMS